MSLKELQQQLGHAILDNKTPEKLAKKIKSTDVLSADQRVQIYQDSILGNFNKSLKVTYPVCEKLVGEAFFTYLTDQYFLQHPPRSQNDSQKFPEFIKYFEPAKSLPYLSDVAKLEQACEIAENAQDTPLLDMQRLTQINEDQPENIVFHLPFGSTLFKSDYPISAIWSANQEGADPNKKISLNQGSDYLLIWRENFTLKIDKLQKNEWIFLNAIIDQPFVSTCETFAANRPNIDTIHLLSYCLKRKWIGNFSLKPT